MFKLGTTYIGNYKVWITVPVFTLPSNDTKYYEVLITKKLKNHNMYVNPIKEILKVEMTDRNPLSKPEDKEHLSQDEMEFRVEANSYNERKNQIMPLTKLSKRHVEQLLQFMCQ